MRSFIFPVLLFWTLILLFPCNNLFMGDGYILKGIFSSPTFGVLSQLKSGAFIHSPLSIFAIQVVGVHLFSYICGFIYFVFAIRLCRIHIKYSILLLLPIIQLFAGYIEQYALFYVVSIALLYYFTIGSRKIVRVLYLVSIFTHLYMAIPLVVFAFYSWSRPWKAIAFALLPTIILVSVFITINKHSALLPLTGYYSMFSHSHLVEYLVFISIQFLWVVPLILHVELKWNPYWLSVLLSLGMLFTVDSSIGFLRDWDLLSFITLPITFAVLSSIRFVPFASLVITLTITTSFMALNHFGCRSLMLEYFRVAPQYSIEYKNGDVLRQTMFILRNEPRPTEEGK